MNNYFSDGNEYILIGEFMWIMANLAENLDDKDFEEKIQKQITADFIRVAIKGINKWLPTKPPLTKLYLVLRKRKEGHFNKLTNIYVHKQGRYGIKQPNHDDYKNDVEIVIFLMKIKTHYEEKDPKNILQGNLRYYLDCYLQTAEIIYFLVSRECLPIKSEYELVLNLSELIKSINSKGKISLFLHLINIVGHSFDAMRMSMKRNMIENTRKQLKVLYLESIKQMQQHTVASEFNSNLFKGDIQLEIKTCQVYLKIMEKVFERNVENKISDIINQIEPSEIPKDKINDIYSKIIEARICPDFGQYIFTDYWDDIDLPDNINFEPGKFLFELKDNAMYMDKKQEHAEVFHRFLSQLFVISQKFGAEDALKVLEFIKKFENGTEYLKEKLKSAIILEKKEEVDIADEITKTLPIFKLLPLFSVSASKGKNIKEQISKLLGDLDSYLKMLTTENNAKLKKLKQNVSRNLGIHKKVISFIFKNKLLMLEACEKNIGLNSDCNNIQKEFADDFCNFFEKLYQILRYFCKDNKENKR